METTDTQSTQTTGASGNAPFSPDFGKIMARVKLVFTDPTGLWPVVKAEPADFRSLCMDYVVVLAAIPPVCTWIGWSFLGPGPIFGGLVLALVQYVLTFVALFVMTLVAEKLAPSFQAVLSNSDAAKLFVHVAMPGWVAGVLNLIPALAPLALLVGIYGLYLLWIGLKEMSAVPDDKHALFFGVLLVTTIVFFILVGAIGAAIAGPMLI